MSALLPKAGWSPALRSCLKAPHRFSGRYATVRFLALGLLDLRDNTTRGVLAEFLVALALGRTESRRKAWDNFDQVTDSGLRIEVKAGGYLQGWAQAKPSALSFGRVAGRTSDEDTNEYGAEPKVRAYVFVFAVQTCREHKHSNALDVGQWEFYVVPADAVRSSGPIRLQDSRHRGGRKQAEPVSFDGLAGAIDAVATSIPERQP